VSKEEGQRIVQEYLRTKSIKATMRFVGRSYNAVKRQVDLYYAQNPQKLNENNESKDLYLAKRQIGELKQEVASLRSREEELERLIKIFSFVDESNKAIPNWTTKKGQTFSKKSIATAFLSDLHLDENVKPEQINHVNGYDRDIALGRIKNFFHNTIELSRDYLQGFQYEGLVLPMGGDFFSGNIHEELTETNAGTIFESLLFWADPICAGVKMMRDAFGRVFIPCVVGNHGRRRHKPHAKNRAQDNFDWFFYHLLRKLLADEKGIEFVISESADQSFAVFDTRFLLTHGDQFRGGSGISGMMSPLFLGDARKRQRQASIRQPYDYLIMGHWHQLAFFQQMVINGALKGFDEYAFICNFNFEPPRQAFWINDSRHGITIKAPIHVTASNEKWMQQAKTEASFTR
jgi:predicted phosphodiesterase